MQASSTQGGTKPFCMITMYPANNIRRHNYGSVQMLTCMVVL